MTTTTSISKSPVTVPDITLATVQQNETPKKVDDAAKNVLEDLTARAAAAACCHSFTATEIKSPN